MPKRRLQRQIPTPIVTYEKPFPQIPFEPEPMPITSRNVETELAQIFPSPAKPELRPPEPMAVEEQYEPAERAALSTSTTEKSYEIITPNPKQILLIAEDQDHLVDFNRPTDASSPKIFSSGSLSMTAKGVRRIFAKTVTGTGTLRILVFKA